MKVKLALIVGLALMFMIGTLTVAMSASTADVLGFAKPDEILAPGEIGQPITISITNLGPSLFNVSVIPLSVYPFTPYSYFNDTNNITIPYLGSGSSDNITVLLNVNSASKDGVYKYYIDLCGYEENGDQVQKKIEVSIPVLGQEKIYAESTWGTANSSMIVGPGEYDVPFTVILQNQGNVMLSNVTLHLHSQYPVKFLQDNVSIGYLPVGQPIFATVLADVYTNATQGVHYITANVTFFRNSSIKVMIPVDIISTDQVTVQSVWGSASSPTIASSGEVNLPITLIVKNLGTNLLSNVTLHLHSQYPVKFLQDNVSIGLIPAGQINEAIVTADVYSNATPGVYYLPVDVTIYQGETLTMEMPVTIAGTVNASITAYTFPPQVFPGYSDVELHIISLNYGSGIAQNATIYIKVPSQIQLISQSIEKIGAMPSGVPINSTFLFNVPNNTPVGNYNINITLKYDGGYFTKIYKLTIYPKANIIISNVYFSGATAGASKIPLTLTLDNIGNSTAKNVILRLGQSDVIYPHVSSSNPLQALTASEYFIGDLKPGQKVNVTYIVDVSSGASPGSYQLATSLEWNQTGSIYPFVQSDTFNVTVSLPLLSKLTTGDSLLILVLAIIVIILIIVLIVVARRRGTRQ